MVGYPPSPRPLCFVFKLMIVPQKAGSIFSSVAVLYHELNNLDAAVQTSLRHLQELVGVFDRTAETVLASLSPESAARHAAAKVIDLMRMVNTGNLEWR